MNYYLKKYDEVNAAMGGFKPEHCINTEDGFEDGRLEDYSTDCDYAFEAEEAGKYAKMEYYATRAAVRGDIFAQFNLGLWYEKGDELPRDYAKAMFWYEVAAMAAIMIRARNWADFIMTDGEPRWIMSRPCIGMKGRRSWAT